MNQRKEVAIWLRARASEQQLYTHGDHLNVLIALNQQRAHANNNGGLNSGRRRR